MCLSIALHSEHSTQHPIRQAILAILSSLWGVPILLWPQDQINQQCCKVCYATEFSFSGCSAKVSIAVDLATPKEMNSVTVEFGQENTELSDAENVPIYLQVSWSNTISPANGSSSSPLFAFFSSSYNTAFGNVNKLNKGHSPARAEVTSSSSPTTALTTSATTTPTTATTAPTGQPTDDGAGAGVGSGSGASSSPPSSSSSPSPSPIQAAKSRSLAPGAIAGIVVGVVVAGLATAGALIWVFCVRPRRGSGDRNGSRPAAPYSSDSGDTRGMMDGTPGIGKEDLPIVVTESDASRHSAYNNGDMGIGIGMGIGGGERPASSLVQHHHSLQQDNETPYTPYSDHPPTPPTPHNAANEINYSGLGLGAGVGVGGGGGGGGGSGSGSSQTDPASSSTRSLETPPPPVNPRYAHLVEDGMTDEQIRQMEEEERHLDAAIQHAGHRAVGPSSSAPPPPPPQVL